MGKDEAQRFIHFERASFPERAPVRGERGEVWCLYKRMAAGRPSARLEEGGDAVAWFGWRGCDAHGTRRVDQTDAPTRVTAQPLFLGEIGRGAV